MKKQSYFNKDALFEACKKVASQTLWQTPCPNNLSDIIDSEQKQKTIQKYFEKSLWYVEFIVEQKRDPNLITRAVLYLLQSHAIPPMKDDLEWFSDMLKALVELACPNSILTKETVQFLYDIEEGIKESFKNLNNS